MHPVASVIVATRNRSALLAHMLPSLERSLAGAGQAVEVVIADNGSTDESAKVIADWVQRGPQRASILVPKPGKAVALNRALELARGPLLVFTDDDVELHPDWLRAILTFAAQHPHYAAAMGRVLLPPGLQDPEVRGRVTYYRTIPLFDSGDEIRDDSHLYGANMFVRRTAFDRVGGFNERLGPGASGLHEDGDLARRLLQAGVRLGYMPGAVVYHVVEPERLTFAYFRTLQLRDAHSRFEMDPHLGWAHSARHWLGACAVWILWGVLGNAGRRLRARGRMISYAELLRLRWRAHHMRRIVGPQGA